MDDPIYRIKDGKRIKMLSLTEGQAKLKKLKDNISEMMETGEWNDYLKEQALQRRKELMFAFVKKMNDNKHAYNLNEDDIKELHTILE